MIIMLRSVALLSLICHISLCASSHAGIFKDEESLSDSQRKAEILKEQILPGKIVLSTLDNSSWPDFMSATPIGKPGDSQTKSILSSAHNLLSWQEDGYWQKRNKNYKVYFCDSWGREYKITDAISLSNDRMDAKNDVALYFLEDDIPCSPHNIIERELSSEPNLASLAYGWELVSSNAAYSVCNLFGEKPYYLQNTPYLNTKGLYAHTYETDRMLHLSNEEGQHRYTYLARQNSESSQDFQFYTHDSGSSWFRQNNVNVDGYFLAALTSQEQAATADVIKTTDRSDNILEEIGLFDNALTLKVHWMTSPGVATNIFTPLAPHREWIYRHIQ